TRHPPHAYLPDPPLFRSENICLRRELARDLLSPRLTKVERQRPLVATDHAPPGRLRALPPLPHWIAIARRFDLDDVRAHVAHERSEEHTSELQSREKLVC